VLGVIMDIQNAIGVVALLIALVALLYQFLKVRQGLAPAASLVSESLHDVALACLGLALLLRGTPARNVLVACFVLLLVAYLARRYLLRTG